MLQIIRPDTNIDFLGARRFWIGLSIATSLVALLAVPLRGVHYGIDFAGGTEIQLHFTGTEPVDEGGVRKAVVAYGIHDPTIVRFGGADTRDFLVRFGERLRAPKTAAAETGPAAPAAAPEAGKAAAAPAAAAPSDEEEVGTPEERAAAVKAFDAAVESKLGPVEIRRVEYVGPRVGAELRLDGLKALVVSWIAILIYVGFRFSVGYAPGAVVALIHDVVIAAGIWVILGESFDLQVLAALLTIIGYSMNDTIIIYDRIRENLAVRSRRELEEVINRSVNQTLSRTLLTHGTVLLSLLALDFLGGPAIRPFSIPMTIGVVVGTYSSIYIASPILLWFEEHRGAAAPAKAAAPRAQNQKAQGPKAQSQKAQPRTPTR